RGPPSAVPQPGEDEGDDDDWGHGEGGEEGDGGPDPRRPVVEPRATGVPHDLPQGLHAHDSPRRIASALSPAGPTARRPGWTGRRAGARPRATGRPRPRGR